MEFVRTSGSAAETALIGRSLGALLREGGGRGGAGDRAGRGGDVLLLDGPLGAGKTTLVRAIAVGMGLDAAPVSSPTFVLIHEYEAPERAQEGMRALIHVDAYRLEGEDELETLGWDRVLERVDRGEAALVIEWAERLGPAALREREPARLRIEHAPAPDPVIGGGEEAEGQGSRELIFTLPESWTARPGFARLVAREPTRCPVTGQPVSADSPTYPFSSERARLADLYHWFSGSYQITRPMEQRDLEEGVD